MLDDVLIAPLLVGLTSLPVFLIAYYVRRGRLHLIHGIDASRLVNPVAFAIRISRLLFAVGFAMLGAAGGLLWAGHDASRGQAVVIAMVVVVNLLGIAIVVNVARARMRDGTPPRR